MTQEIWQQLIYIRGFNTISGGKNTYSRLLQLKRRTGRESPQKSNAESKRFLDRLERSLKIFLL